MPREYCPKCQHVTNAEVTKSLRKVLDHDGNAREVWTEVVHCEACGAFIRSEDISAEQDGPAEQ
ncbi:MAG: hypothetical protein ACYS8L_01645 [Planctomycetota bacterium]|jgi:uncharacterized Zn finger protein